jgi:hypothetical protein
MVTTAVDKWPAYARLLAVAPAGHLPTAPTPPPGTRPLPVVTVYWLRIVDRCGEAMLAAEEAIRRFSNGAGAYAVLGHCKTETGHAEEEIPLQAQAIRLNPGDRRPTVQAAKYT